MKCVHCFLGRHFPLKHSMAPPLNAILQQLMQNVAPEAHVLSVVARRVLGLSVCNRRDEHILEFAFGSQETRSHKVHHRPVLEQVVLQWSPCQNHTTSRTDTTKRFRKLLIWDK